MIKNVLYYLSIILGIVLVCLGLRYFFTHYGNIDEHCNCVPKQNFSDTIDISRLKIFIDDYKSVDFITTPDKLKSNIGIINYSNNFLYCAGLIYKKNDIDSSLYKIVRLNTISNFDRAKIVDESNELEYDFEFKITTAFNYFKKSTECMDCRFGNTYKGHRNGYQYCSYSVCCKNGDFSKAVFSFQNYYLTSISFE